MATTNEPEICDTCGLPIVPNVDACYTAADPGPRHWDCHKKVHLGGHSTTLEAFDASYQDFKRLYAEAMETIAQLRSRIP